MITLQLRRVSALAALCATMAIPASVLADEVHLTGSTLGSFDGSPFLSSASLLGLSYSNSAFDNSTVGGYLDLGGNPDPGMNFNNLGSFTLANINDTYTGNTFQVLVDFTAPTIITGGSSTVYTDLLTGQVKNGNGGVYISFTTPPQTFTFSNSTAKGWFTLAVNNVSVAPGQSASLTGHVIGYQQAVPEPSSMAVFGVGALGLVVKLRKRKLS